MERIEPLLATLRIEPLEPMLRIEPAWAAREVRDLADMTEFSQLR